MKKTFIIAFFLSLALASLIASAQSAEDPGREAQAARAGDMVGSIYVVAPSGILAGGIGRGALGQSSAAALEQVELSREDLKKSDWLAAIRHASAAIAIDSRLVEAYSNRAWAYIEKGLYSEAIADCETAIAIDGYSGEAFNNLGLAYQRQGDSVRAATYYRQACQLGNATGCQNSDRLKQAAAALVAESLEFFNKGDYSKVVELTTSALDLDDSLAVAYVNRAGAKANLGHYAAAIEDAGKAIALDADNCLAFNNLGYAQEQSDQQALAKINYEIGCSLGCTIACDNHQRLAAKDVSP